MRNFVLPAALAVALAACNQQPPAETPPAGEASRAMTDPAAVVRQLYEPYLTPNATFPSFEEQAPWSASLWSVLSAMSARSQALNEPILDFDPVIGAQDYELSNVTATTESLVEASHATVRAHFTNIGQEQDIYYDMVWEGDRWKVDNIRGDVGGSPWDLRVIASAPNAAAIP